jgi:hypothetical protein
MKQEVTKVECLDGHERQIAKEVKRLENLAELNVRELKILEQYKQLKTSYDSSLAKECYKQVDALMTDYQMSYEFSGCVRLFEVYKYLIDNNKS